jgi:hypothetical protein
MPRQVEGSSSAPAAAAGLLMSIAHLEAAERELLEQGLTITEQLNATRDAIAALRRVAPGAAALSAAGRAPRPPAGAPETPARNLKAGTHGSAAASARERALLSIIGAGTVSRPALIAAMPQDGLTPKQQTAAVANALHRLKVGGLVTNGEGYGSWALTAKGRKAVNAVKEVP